MDRSRDAVLAEMQPIRLDIIQLAEHLVDGHGIRPERREKTDPGVMPERLLGRWLVRHAGVGVDDASISEDDEDHDEKVGALRELASKRQRVCALEGCPGVDTLTEAHGNLVARRNVLREELPEPSERGAVQTVRPKGLDVEALTGILGRAEA